MIIIINNTLTLITSPQVNLQDNFSPALDSYLKNDRGQAILLLPILFNHLIWILTHLLRMEGPSQRLLHSRWYNLLKNCSLILIPSTIQQCPLKLSQSLLGSKDNRLIHPIILAILPVLQDSINNKDHQKFTCVLVAVTTKVMSHKIPFRQGDPRPPSKWIVLDGLYYSRPRGSLQVFLCQLIINRTILHLRRSSNMWILQQMYLAISITTKAQKIGGRNETKQMLSQWPIYQYMMPIASICTTNPLQSIPKFVSVANLWAFRLFICMKFVVNLIIGSQMY